MLDYCVDCDEKDLPSGYVLFFTVSKSNRQKLRNYVYAEFAHDWFTLMMRIPRPFLQTKPYQQTDLQMIQVLFGPRVKHMNAYLQQIADNVRLLWRFYLQKKIHVHPLPLPRYQKKSL